LRKRLSERVEIGWHRFFNRWAEGPRGYRSTGISRQTSASGCPHLTQSLLWLRDTGSRTWAALAARGRDRRVVLRNNLPTTFYCQHTRTLALRASTGESRQPRKHQRGTHSPIRRKRPRPRFTEHLYSPPVNSTVFTASSHKRATVHQSRGGVAGRPQAEPFCRTWFFSMGALNETLCHC